MLQATIFDLKEFAIYDGPGVRQTVFLKGCPLNCQWCHNPEGLVCYPQLMCSQSGCTNCGNCKRICANAGASCNACGRCVQVCPQGLRKISGETITSAQLVDTIRRNSQLYASLGGGVTFSGGEPLLQYEFLLEVLYKLTDLHTAIETSAFAPHNAFAAVAKHVSLVIADIKIMDSTLHMRYTGVDNSVILSNLSTLCAADKPFVIRIPLIPGVNDTNENIAATACFLQGAKALQCVELLPYHKTAGAKYGMLGKGYNPVFDTEAEANRNFTQIFDEHKIRSRVL